MNKKIWSTAAVIFSLFIFAACIPSEVEPGVVEGIWTPTPSHAPTAFPRPEKTVAPASPTPIGIEPHVLPLHPDAAPTSLPVYTMVLSPIPATGDTALAWARSFGFAGGQVMEETEEMVRILDRDAAAGMYEELTFLRMPYNQVVGYSSGVDWQNPGAPTPTPSGQLPPLLPPEMVTSIALDFVRQHNLLPEPVIAHEFPSYDDRYIVHVAFALSGFRLTGIGEGPGVTVYVDGSGRVSEARIVQASFAAAESVNIIPLEQIYAGPAQRAERGAYFNERAKLGDIDSLDPMRFQAHSLPYGDEGERAELVYAPLPTRPERIVPMWLITRPDSPTWDHYLEFFLLAATGETVPRPFPSRTPLAQRGVIPESLRIVPPLLVDETNGRLYANAAVNGITHTVTLDAATGDLLAVFGLTGDLALDASRNQLYVDNYPHGLTVIDTTTDEPLNDIGLPAGERGHARLQADSATGNVLLFRDQMLLIADPWSETWQNTVPFIVEGTVCGEPMEKPPMIEETWFDDEARLLYVALADYVCTPQITYTVVVFDLNTLSEVARHPGLGYLSGVAVNGRFYAKDWVPPDKTFQWAWQNGQPWLEPIDRGEDLIGGISGFHVDEKRGWLYEMTVNGLQLLDMETMAVVQTLPVPVDGHLMGFDPITDDLYFLESGGGRLLIWPASNIRN